MNESPDWWSRPSQDDHQSPWKVADARFSATVISSLVMPPILPHDPPWNGAGRSGSVRGVDLGKSRGGGFGQVREAPGTQKAASEQIHAQDDLQDAKLSEGLGHKHQGPDAHDQADGHPQHAQPLSRDSGHLDSHVHDRATLRRRPCANSGTWRHFAFSGTIGRSSSRRGTGTFGPGWADWSRAKVAL